MIRKKLPHQPTHDPWAQDMGWVTSRLRQKGVPRQADGEISQREKQQRDKEGKMSQRERHMQSVMEGVEEKENQSNSNSADREKIDLLSRKLEQLYLHYREEETHLTQMQTKIAETSALAAENDSLATEISSIRNMLKEVLLTRERGKIAKIA